MAKVVGQEVLGGLPADFLFNLLAYLMGYGHIIRNKAASGQRNIPVYHAARALQCVGQGKQGGAAGNHIVYQQKMEAGQIGGVPLKLKGNGVKQTGPRICLSFHRAV